MTQQTITQILNSPASVEKITRRARELIAAQPAAPIHAYRPPRYIRNPEKHLGRDVRRFANWREFDNAAIGYTVEAATGRLLRAPSAADTEIASLVANIRGTVDAMDAMETQVSIAKDRLRVLLTGRGDNWKDDDGYVRLVADSVRATYNTKELDALILADPIKNGWLIEYRKEFTVRGGVQVR